MFIYEGIVMEIVDAEKRLIKCKNIPFMEDIICEVIFANNEIDVGDSVLIITISHKILSHAYAIPLPGYVEEQSLNNIKIFYRKNEIHLDEENIKITFNIGDEEKETYMHINNDKLEIHKKEGESTIYIDKDTIEIKKKDKALIQLKNDYIEINTKELFVPGMPKPNPNESKGGFSQILYCPFTGLPHNTDRLEQQI